MPSTDPAAMAFLGAEAFAPPARIECPCCKSGNGQLQIYDVDGAPLAMVPCCHCSSEGKIPT